MRAIVQSAPSRAAPLGALTTMPRDDWAHAREVCPGYCPPRAPWNSVVPRKSRKSRVPRISRP